MADNNNSNNNDKNHNNVLYYRKIKKKLNDISLPNKSFQGYEVSLAITQCYLPPDTSELASTNPRQTG